MTEHTYRVTLIVPVEQVFEVDAKSVSHALERIRDERLDPVESYTDLPGADVATVLRIEDGSTFTDVTPRGSTHIPLHTAEIWDEDDRREATERRQEEIDRWNETT
jgi:hypothetical protein